LIILDIIVIVLVYWLMIWFMIDIWIANEQNRIISYAQLVQGAPFILFNFLIVKLDGDIRYVSLII
jgi:hypothetical protein